MTIIENTHRVLKVTICVLVALSFSLSASCQTHDSLARTKMYHVNHFVAGGIIAGGMAGDYFAVIRIKTKKDLTDEELLFANTQQQKDLLNPIDQWSLKQNPADRARYKQISDYGQVGVFLLPTLLLFNENVRKDWFDILMMYVEGHTITFTMYNYSPLGATFQNRFRPIVYYPEFSDKDRKSGGNRNSFFSGHVGSCAYSTFFMAKVYCDYHPNIGFEKYLLYLAASVPPLYIGYARIKSLDHFPSDVLVGFGLGAIIGIVVPELHKNHLNKHLAFGVSTSPDEMGLSIHWKLPYQHVVTIAN